MRCQACLMGLTFYFGKSTESLHKQDRCFLHGACAGGVSVAGCCYILCQRVVGGCSLCFRATRGDCWFCCRCLCGCVRCVTLATSWRTWRALTSATVRTRQCSSGPLRGMTRLREMRNWHRKEWSEGSHLPPSV